MDPAVNPFAALSFIVAPAVLTNASSVLTLGTSNRLARAVDRTRELTTALASERSAPQSLLDLKSRELTAAQRRVIMLIQALRSFYLALGGFASTALVSAMGALGAMALPAVAALGLEILAGVCGTLGVIAMLRGSFLLVVETRIAVEVLTEEANRVQAEFIEMRNRHAAEC
ncbi:MAG: DUF2721 domain-containing protein [Bdellovibrionota bacterium]